MRKFWKHNIQKMSFNVVTVVVINRLIQSNHSGLMLLNYTIKLLCAINLTMNIINFAVDQFLMREISFLCFYFIRK